MSIEEIIAGRLDALRGAGCLRAIPQPAPDSVDFTSNDYLGLAKRRNEFAEEYHDAFGNLDFTSSASRLLARHQDIYVESEDYIGSLYEKNALLFNSGYHANVGAVSALASLQGAVAIADKLVHASIIDGLKLSGSRFHRFPHNDMAALERLIERHAPEGSPVIIIVESIYSMDGDFAPLQELVELRRRHPGVFIYLDEAHALGVRGDRGLGLAEEMGLLPEIDLIVGTLGKALASSGAFIAASESVCEFLVNSARSFIFSTCLPPSSAAWSLLMMKKMTGMQAERARLEALSSRARRGLEAISGAPSAGRTQILPFMVGDATEAVMLSRKLRERGLNVLPIRHPTVPAGTERLRISLSAAHSESDIDLLIQALSELK